LSAKRSKKPSAKPNSSEPRKDAVFFVDRSLGRIGVASALRAAGFPVVAHDERFDPATPDEYWLETAGKEGWIVLSADKSIRRKPDELKALRRHKVRAVFLTSGNLKGSEQAKLCAQNGRKIQDSAMSTQAPAMFSLTKSGDLNPLGPRPAKRRRAKRP